jgi:hypothetical protein
MYLQAYKSNGSPISLIGVNAAYTVLGSGVSVDATGGIAASSGTPISFANATGVVPLQTDQLSSSIILPQSTLTVGGIFDYNQRTGTLNPFTIGLDALFVLYLTGSGTISVSAVQFSVEEMPKA